MKKLLKLVLPASEWLGSPFIAFIGRFPAGSIVPGAYGRYNLGLAVLVAVIGLVFAPFLPAVTTVLLAMAATAFLRFVGLLQMPTKWLAPTMAAPFLLVALLVGVIGDVAYWWWITALVGAIAVWYGAKKGFRKSLGPHHEPSDLSDPYVDSAIKWLWTGGVTESSATIVLRLAPGVPASAVSVVVTSPTGSPQAVNQTASHPHGICRYGVSSLLAGTEYAIEISGGNSGPAHASFTTFGAFQLGTTQRVRLAAGSCQSTGSRGMVFETIASLDPKPDVFLQLGDLHYENIGRRDIEPYLDAYDDVLTSPPQAHLYRKLPMAYVWDDHDFGKDNSDGSSKTKPFAREAYRMAVPNYIDDDTDARCRAIYQSFKIGRVLVLLTDNRSERDQTKGTMLGKKQRDWLTAQISTAGPDVAAIVWGASTPWIGAEGDKSWEDIWAGFPDERSKIAEVIAASHKPVVLVHGDAHNVAIDDGSNSSYHTVSGKLGPVVLGAAALDREPSDKGGDYSEGKHLGAGQFGTIDVTDRGETVDITLTAWDFQGPLSNPEPLTRHYQILTE